MLVANYDYETDIRVHAEEAAEKTARETALRMLEDGMSVAKVANYAGLTIEEVTELQKAMLV